jgi:hypothetical protein
MARRILAPLACGEVGGHWFAGRSVFAGAACIWSSIRAVPLISRFDQSRVRYNQPGIRPVQDLPGRCRSGEPEIGITPPQGNTICYNAQWEGFATWCDGNRIRRQFRSGRGDYRRMRWATDRTAWRRSRSPACIHPGGRSLAATSDHTKFRRCGAMALTRNPGMITGRLSE